MAAAADNGTGPVCRIGVRWYLRRHDERGGGERRVREDEVPRGCAEVSMKRVCPGAAAAAASPWRGVWCGETSKVAPVFSFFHVDFISFYCLRTLELKYLLGYVR